MGSVKVDLSKGEKRLETRYPLDTSNGVRALLENIHHVRESRIQRGDYDAVILLLDMLQSYEEARLTARQREVLTLTYERDLKQESVAELLGISQQGVSDHINAAIRKIALYNHVREEGNHVRA
jgi:DNA-directed RNA polymerase specialized sigma subunit